MYVCMYYHQTKEKMPTPALLERNEKVVLPRVVTGLTVKSRTLDLCVLITNILLPLSPYKTLWAPKNR